MKLAEAKPCFEELREEWASPLALVGPVDLAALARLAGSRFSETGFLDLELGLGESDSGVRMSFRPHT
jgi:hypothetical protein